jgi:hypothetical protein
MQGFAGKARRKEIILKWITDKYDGGVWTAGDLTQDGDRWLL